MPTQSCVLLLLALSRTFVAGAPKEFEVTSLPGWEGPLVSKAYCGFTAAGVPPSGEGQMFFNYIFIESENDPANDPVIVWYNGGPGAASMFGLFVELGPYYLNQDSLDDPKYNTTGIPQVQPNPHSWTKVANVVAVNNPPPIGFSYCEGGSRPNTGPSGDGYSCGPWDDSAVAKANHAFLKALFSIDFPEYAKNPLFITGESYAVIYVPTIVREIIADPGPLNLAGFAVGDGCMGTEVLCGTGNPDKGPFYRVEFMHGHGQVSERNYQQIQRECPEAVLHSGTGMSTACTAASARFPQQPPTHEEPHDRVAILGTAAGACLPSPQPARPRPTCCLTQSHRWTQLSAVCLTTLSVRRAGSEPAGSEPAGSKPAGSVWTAQAAAAADPT